MPPQSKRARQALAGTSLPAPEELVSAPRSSEQAEKPAAEGSHRKQDWVLDQFVEIPSAKGKGEWKCRHDGKVLSGRNKSRMKEHLLNPGACAFYNSSAARELQQVEPVGNMLSEARKKARGQQQFSK